MARGICTVNFLTGSTAITSKNFHEPERNPKDLVTTSKDMMKKTLLLIAITACAAATHASAQMLVINEVYPGGGSANTSAAYTRDFVEIYNPGSTTFNLTGYALQYAPSTSGTFSGTIVLFGAGSQIGPMDYLTISTGSAGTGGATLAVGTGNGNADYVATGGASLSATAGSVRLYNTATSTTVDLVGYGTISNTSGDPKFNGMAAASPTNVAVSIDRTNFVNTSNNQVDFSSQVPSPNGGTTGMDAVVPAPEPSTTWAVMAGAASLIGVMVYRRNRTA